MLKAKFVTSLFWEILILSVCICSPVLSDIYVDPNEEIIVADSINQEYEPEVSGATVTWTSRPVFNKDGVSLFLVPEELEAEVKRLLDWNRPRRLITIHR